MITRLSRRALLASVPAALVAASKSEVHLGCQTNSWKIDPKNFSTFLAVLDRIKAFGFTGFETSFLNVQGQFGNAAEARREIDKRGLSFFGVHIFLLNYDPHTLIAPAAQIHSVVDGGALLGAGRLVLSGNAVSPGGIFNRDMLASKIAALNAAGQYARSRNMRVAYHNHDREFANGGLEMQKLMSGTNPTLVDFVLDAGHARRAGANVAQFFAQYHQRIAAIHLRDLSDKPGDHPELGPFDLHGLHRAIDRTDWPGWLIVEEENAVNKSGDEAVAPAREKLREEFKF